MKKRVGVHTHTHNMICIKCGNLHTQTQIFGSWQNIYNDKHNSEKEKFVS